MELASDEEKICLEHSKRKTEYTGYCTSKALQTASRIVLSINPFGDATTMVHAFPITNSNRMVFILKVS